MSLLPSIQTALLKWFQAEQRNLPWRQNYRPYEIWISEIMLQQTQMDRVVRYFTRWMETFPTVADLAAANEDEVLKCWEGLGYYSRARNIIKTAQILVDTYGGVIPSSTKQLLQLPGIGPYTAGAISSIGFNCDAPVVDANIERIFARLFSIDLPQGESKTRRVNWEKAHELLPHGNAREFNQALMELGSLICRPKNPNCSLCPIAPHCLALSYDRILQLPVPKKSSKIIPIEMATGLLLHNDQIFIQQRLADDVWGSLWEFPGGRIEKGETAKQAVIREFQEETEFAITVKEKLTTTLHHYTRYKVTLHCFLVKLAQQETDPVLHAAQEYHWLPFEDLHRFAFPAGHRKFIDFLQIHHNF